MQLFGLTQPNILSKDSIPIDSLAQDSIRKKAILEDIIKYSADDSIVVSLNGQEVYMYKNAKVTYQDIELKAYYIKLNLEKKEVFAEGIKDSTEKWTEKPNFKQGGEKFESRTLRYNFDTKKAIIEDVITEQGEGFIHSKKAKKISDEIFIMKDGKYTTCDLEHPHFYLHLTKAKVISNNKIVTGPAYMVLEDFPVYFPFLPFGFFPSTPTYSSGILMPTYGEEQNRGFFLRNGGYYWAAGKYFDLAVTGDIFSRGSWGVRVNSNYKKRYKFNGSFNLQFANNKSGFKGLDTYNERKEFSIQWSHSQDTKANPSQTFRASVNFSSSGFEKDNAYNSQDYLTNRKQSSISYSKRFENTPFSLSVNLRHSQNSRDSSLTLILPEFTFNVSKIYPFRRKKRSGPLRWYEKFGFNYSVNARNTITAKEKEILQKSLVKDWKNGIKHNLPISLPGFNLFKHINVSPSFSYNEKWYFKKYKYRYDEASNTVITDTIQGLSRVFDYSYGLSASTNIYGMFLPLNSKSRIKGIRHKISPSIGFSYRPDFGKERFHYWQHIQVDESGNFKYFDTNYGGIYGGSPSRGASGSINFSVNNNIEMKVLNKSDTIQSNSDKKFKKIKLIDNLSLNTSYNLIADSLNLSPINVRARTTIKGVSISMGGVIDPYLKDEKGQTINKYAWKHKKGFAKLGKLRNANLSFGMNFSSKKNKKNKTKSDKEDAEDNLPDIYNEYVKFNTPWTFGFDYSFNYRAGLKPTDKGKITQTVGMRASLNLTDKWSIRANSNFDITAGKFSYTRFNLHRDLHCWEFSLGFVPFGYRKSYNFTIRVKSSMLKDLQIKKNQSHYDR